MGIGKSSRPGAEKKWNAGGSIGLSWQIVPTMLGELMGDKDKDKEKAKRVMQAMLKLKKIEIEGLKRAAYES